LESPSVIPDSPLLKVEYAPVSPKCASLDHQYASLTAK